MQICEWANLQIWESVNLRFSEYLELGMCEYTNDGLYDYLKRKLTIFEFINVCMSKFATAQIRECMNMW